MKDKSYDIQPLVYSLVDLSKMIENKDEINGSIVEYINTFIEKVKKYYLSKNIPIPVTITYLDKDSTKKDWLEVINRLQMLLSDSKDSLFFIRGNLTYDK